MRRFAGLELDEDVIPDETTALNFRYLLEGYNLASAVFEGVKAYLGEQGLLLSSGSIVNATIIHAPSSTKNPGRECGSEMSSTKKGNTWHPSAALRTGFGMKAHISVDADSERVHTVGVNTVEPRQQRHQWAHTGGRSCRL